ncbi:DUF1549 and DUF1553 domain-containing protein [Brevifollis gellanilyticus]|uniref:DUF1553 domain-containing protein n=1 Tax=Brevifollis gellanilyticus TaxID=748831 RepID=A0A512MEM6_9BACT|nr:DUF1549 and DUF1553 domain-containing protein [Brevifollis gellanilyticus]GEP45187.1 hypothetical protein BGE01nite_44780 [Brevifollis gellanilyticus]
MPSRAAIPLILLCSGLAMILPAAEPVAIDWVKARQHWSFVPPKAQPLPQVKDRSWPRERVDHFILSRIEKGGLTPSPEAEVRTLLRRVFFDLTGLPPSPEEIRAFLADSRPGAYERLVDDLLGRRAFGEKMASQWLNLARYGEDQAHQVGNNTSLNLPNAWRYRDWVVAAFNADLPYDAFIQKQLAVDLIEPQNKEDLPALGFLGLGHKLYSRGRLDVQAEEWAEQVDTVSQTFLGLTVACARCHDHKFDPITSRDYYAMAGIFASMKKVSLRPDGKDEEDKTNADKMDPGTLHIVRDENPRDLPIYERGDVESPGGTAPRGWLQVLSPGDPVKFQQGSGRAELARRIADASNPLTARVMVNRIWDMLFGRPLAHTSSNFGSMGDKPTHPELLDDLAIRFMRDGWSVKRLVRELVLSATYRQSCSGSAANAQLDEANASFWRMNRRRLGIEPWRDAILSIAGTLTLEGGPSLSLDSPAHHKRTLYSQVSRKELNKTLMLFDYPDANVHAARRSESSTPTQKLFVMNSVFMIEQSKKLAHRLQQSASDDPARIRFAYELLFAREPQPEELAIATEFLQEPAESSLTAWEQFAQALLATNEMIYVD